MTSFRMFNKNGPKRRRAAPRRYRTLLCAKIFMSNSGRSVVKLINIIYWLVKRRVNVSLFIASHWVVYIGRKRISLLKLPSYLLYLWSITLHTVLSRTLSAKWIVYFVQSLLNSSKEHNIEKKVPLRLLANTGPIFAENVTSIINF